MADPIIFNAGGTAGTQFDGNLGGGVAQKLMASGFNVGALRPFINRDDGKSYITINNKNHVLAANNATLLYDEWKNFDNVIIKAFQEDLTFASGIMSRGLTYPLANPLGTTIVIHQNMSNAMQAQMAMDANVQNSGDTPEFGEGGVPIPIISSGFNIDIRFLNAARTSQVPLDTTNSEFAARANAVWLENLTLFGKGDITDTEKVTLDFSSTTVTAALRYTYGNYKIDGVFSKDEAVDYPLGYDWLAATTTGVNMVSDVLNMKQALTEQGYGGDAVLHLPSYMSIRLAEDYKSAEASTTMTIMNRLEQIRGVSYEFHDAIGRITPGSGEYVNMAMIAMRSDVIRMINGFESMLVQWDTQGGMNTNYRILTIMVPELRTRQAGDCGIVKANFVRA
jgi:hypothetical protein